jgi:hypothetical protein
MWRSALQVRGQLRTAISKPEAQSYGLSRAGLGKFSRRNFFFFFFSSEGEKEA